MREKSSTYGKSQRFWFLWAQSHEQACEPYYSVEICWWDNKRCCRSIINVHSFLSKYRSTSPGYLPLSHVGLADTLIAREEILEAMEEAGILLDYEQWLIDRSSDIPF